MEAARVKLHQCKCDYTVQEIFIAAKPYRLLPTLLLYTVQRQRQHQFAHLNHWLLFRLALIELLLLLQNLLLVMAHDYLS